MGQNIPVRVLNPFIPFAVGTLVSAEEYPSVKAVSSKKGITMVTVEALDMIDARGFLAAVFAAFGRHGLSVDVLASSEASISVTVDRLVPPGLVEDLRAFSTVDVREGMAVACLVGGGIRGRTDVLRRLFASVTDVRVEMVSQGASARNVTFVVAEADADRAVRSVYREFFASDV
jgi:aspartokinase